MAIPFYTPEGIGPVDANNNSQHIGLNTRANQTQVNQVTLRDRPQQPITIASFPHQIIQELYSFYQTHVAPQVSSQIYTMEPQRVNHTDNQRRGRSLTARNNEDEETGESHPLNSLPLPDIIECHAGFSVDFTYEGCLVDTYINNRDILRPHIPSSNNNEPNDGMEELPLGRADWRLQLKLLVGPWQQTGMELRAIADHFQLEYTVTQQQRSSQRRQRLRCKLMVSLGIPTLALVGLGIAWLRRH